MTPAVPAAATPERLTEVLRRSGVLGDERVTDVRPESERHTLLSTLMRLRLTYDGGKGASLPTSLYFKTRRQDSTVTFEESGRREVEFYARVASLMPAGHVPRCFEAVVGAEGGWHLLLEDLGASHEIVSDWPLPPTIEQCERVVEAHARFHAFWWDDTRLGVSVGTFLDAGAFDQFLATFPKQFSDFANRLGDRLSVDRRRIYERLIEAAPDLLARYRSHRDLTIIHGDAHTWNAFYPRDPDRDQVRLFDWDGWRIDVGTDDLAYMMAVHWYPERRRRLERPCLARYHAALVARGVRGYDFDALWRDYRLSVLWQLATPVWQAAHKLTPVIWWSHLERVMLAVEDLDALAFLR